MSRKRKQDPEPLFRIDPPETWYYVRREFPDVFPIEGVTGERGSCVITRDGIEFPKSDIFPTERAARRSIEGELSRERGLLLARLRQIDAALARLTD